MPGKDTDKRKRTLIWLGVGYGAYPKIDLQAYDNVIFVDARRGCLENLKSLSLHEKTTFSNVAVSEHGEESQQLFTILSVEEYSSLSAVKELRSLFPGLKERKSISVNVVSASSLISELQLSESSSTLILDIPDKAFGILKNLVDTGEIRTIQTVIVLSSEFTLYEGMTPIASIRKLLEKQFFELVGVDNNDPDIPYFTFSFSANRYEIYKLQTELEQANTELDSIRQKLLDSEKEIQLIKQDSASSSEAFFGLKDTQPYFTGEQKALFEKGEALATNCFQSKNQLELLEKISLTLAEKDTSQLSKFAFCCKASELFAEKKDELMAVHFINTATRYVEKDDNGQLVFELTKRALVLNKWDLAVDFSIASMSKFLSREDFDGEHYLHAFTEIRRASKKKQQHGHDLLIEYIHSNKNDALQQNKKTFVEIGTTREDIPGQGSTIQLATLCHELGIQFITVDMDPNNTQLATITMMSESLSGVAINKKGEDYLAEYNGQLDFVFLDAYDFDHGNHSELRQARYEKYLGQRIDEKECHVMHLKCAESLNNILSKEGVICIDDTWRDEQNKWTAKGTLAVPFLLNQGFKIIDERNRAVLLKRC
ncbi:O-methyltransferase [Alteromonas macleodii]|uniref:hypothetical protein n=1 Tax=Alteromonas macleodii TaxID=28108 RepID=UPI0031406E25